MYGHDKSAPMDFVVDEPYDMTTPTTACGWNRVLAMRIAVVTRSAQMASPAASDPTTSAPTWSDSASQPIDLSDNASWKRFRYRTFQTTVPLRNTRWMDPGKASGC
jgi:type IV pilus assembly protein PilW